MIFQLEKKSIYSLLSAVFLSSSLPCYSSAVSESEYLCVAPKLLSTPPRPYSTSEFGEYSKRLKEGYALLDRACSSLANNALYTESIVNKPVIVMEVLPEKSQEMIRVMAEQLPIQYDSRYVTHYSGKAGEHQGTTVDYYSLNDEEHGYSFSTLVNRAQTKKVFFTSPVRAMIESEYMPYLMSSICPEQQVCIFVTDAKHKDKFKTSSRNKHDYFSIIHQTMLDSYEAQTDTSWDDLVNSYNDHTDDSRQSPGVAEYAFSRKMPEHKQSGMGDYPEGYDDSFLIEKKPYYNEKNEYLSDRKKRPYIKMKDNSRFSKERKKPPHHNYNSDHLSEWQHLHQEELLRHISMINKYREYRSKVYGFNKDSSTLDEYERFILMIHGESPDMRRK